MVRFQSIFKKVFLVTSFLFQIFFISCSKNPSERAEKYLTYWSAANQQEIDLAAIVVEKWNLLHPEFPVRTEPIASGQSSEEVLLAAIAGRTTPDICSNIWPGVLEQYVEAQVVVLLDTMPGFDSLITSRIPDRLVSGYASSDGKYYQIPWKSNPVLFIYNTNYFDVLDIKKVPTTYKEFDNISRKVLELSKTGESPIKWMHYRNVLPIWWQRLFDFYPFYIAASGGKTLLKDGKVDFDNDSAVKVFEFFASGYREGFVSKSILQMEDLFIKEKVLADIVGPWRVSHLAKFAPHINYKYGPLPRPDDVTGPPLTYADPKSIVIFKTAPYPEMAWEFVKFMVSEESDRLLLEIATQLPIRKNLLENETFDEFFEKNPELTLFAEQVTYAVGVDKTIYLQEIFDIISQEFEAACIHHVKTPSKGIKDAAKRVRLLLARDRT
ncbi:MAG: extracellular solute-binding protein [Candidatus Marinimicrobia bacterium]|nr:extracellular solute-binding protein [Candidatus Neomarinimicrobiota bacterium]